MEPNELAPHTTVVWVKAITYEILPTGECSGIPVQKQEKILQVQGKNLEECKQNTLRFLEDLANVTKTEEA